jgi:hypothetical protein
MLKWARNKFVALGHNLVAMAAPETSGCSSWQNRVMVEIRLTSGSEPNASLWGETRASSHLSQKAPRHSSGTERFLVKQEVTWRQ